MTAPGSFVPGVVLDADTDMDELPGGGMYATVPSTTNTSGIGATATVVGNGADIASTIAGRRYKISVHVPVRQRTSVGLVTCEIRRGTGTIINAGIMTLGVDEYGTFDFCITDVPGAVGLQAYFSYLKTSAATVDTAFVAGTAQTIGIEDLGPF